MSKYEISIADAEKLKPIAMAVTLGDVPSDQLERFLVDLEALEQTKLRDTVIEAVHARLRYLESESDAHAAQVAIMYHMVSSVMMDTEEV